MAGGKTVEIACARLRRQGVKPIAALDYVRAQQYGNRAMREAFREIVDGALKEGVALVGGESAEHDHDTEDFSDSYVWVLGLKSWQLSLWI